MANLSTFSAAEKAVAVAALEALDRLDRLERRRMPSYHTAHRTPARDPLPIQEQPTAVARRTPPPSIAETFSAAELSTFSPAEKKIALTALDALDRMDRLEARLMPSLRTTKSAHAQIHS
ncbi:unnamed protein product [Mortierella alpina]